MERAWEGTDPPAPMSGVPLSAHHLFCLPLKSVLYFLPVSLAFPVHRPLEIRDRGPHGRLPLTCAVPVQGSWTWEYALEEQGRIQKQMYDWGQGPFWGSGGVLFP